MPCRDEGAAEETVGHLSKQVDQLTAFLCEMCGRHGLDGASAELRGWWKEHQEWDRRRVAQEEKERKAEEAKRTALGKLTKEERKLLGLKEDP